MKRIATGVAFALMLAPVLAHAEEKSTTKTTSKDAERTAGNPMNTPDTDKTRGASSSQEKMTDARLIALLQHVNKDEIDAGNLAQKQGKSAEIKNFGKKLVADHTRSHNEVAAAAKKAGISQDETALTPHDRQMMKIDKNKMDELKKMVDDTIPVLEQHKDMADDAASKANRASAGSNQGRSPEPVKR